MSEAAHSHAHGHHHHHKVVDNIKVVLILNLGFSLVELVGGFWTGSVAILSDAVHDLGDSLSLGVAWGLEKLATRGSNQSFTYGYRRMSLLSALITSSFLIIGSVLVLTEAIPRLFNPVEPKLGGMFALGLLGIVVNGYAAWRVHGGRSLNEQVVSWHMLEDVFGWVAVLLGSVIMMFVDAPIIDPILSVGFTVFILWRVFQSLRATVRLFLQATPEEVDVTDLRQEIVDLDGVLSTHDAHMWSLDGQHHVFTLHVVVRRGVTIERMEEIKNKIREVVSARGQIHVTVEMESEAEPCPDVNCT